MKSYSSPFCRGVRNVLGGRSSSHRLYLFYCGGNQCGVIIFIAEPGLVFFPPAVTTTYVIDSYDKSDLVIVLKFGSRPIDRVWV